jgi:hypothetical protein
MPDHMKKYIAPPTHMYSVNPPNTQEDLSDFDLEDLTCQCRERHSAWRMFPAVSRALPSILRDEANPLEILFSSKAAKEFSVQSSGTLALDSQTRTFLDLFTHDKPG